MQTGAEDIVLPRAFHQLVFEQSRVGEIQPLSVFRNRHRQRISASGNGSDPFARARVDYHHAPVALIDDVQEPPVRREREIRCEALGVERHAAHARPVFCRPNIYGPRFAGGIVKQPSVRRVRDAGMHLHCLIALGGGGNGGDPRFGRIRMIDDAERKRPANARKNNLLPVRPNRERKRKRRHSVPGALGSYSPAVR